MIMIEFKLFITWYYFAIWNKIIGAISFLKYLVVEFRSVVDDKDPSDENYDHIKIGFFKIVIVK